jgi:hypothetical protein
MKPLKVIYWLRLALGIVVALICIGFGLITGAIPNVDQNGGFPMDVSVFMNGLSIAILFYLLSYYVIKLRFVNRVEKPSKLMTTGIGIYLLSWIVLWVLLYTLLAA